MASGTMLVIWGGPDRLDVGHGGAPHLGNVGAADLAQRARAFPQQGTVASGLRLTGRLAHVPQRPAADARGVDGGANLQAAGAVELDGDFLADQGGILAAGEG